MGVYESLAHVLAKKKRLEVLTSCVEQSNISKTALIQPTLVQTKKNILILRHCIRRSF